MEVEDSGCRVSFFLFPINMELGRDSLFPPYLLCPSLLPNTFLQSPLNQACALKASLGILGVSFGLWWVSSLGASAICLVRFPSWVGSLNSCSLISLIIWVGKFQTPLCLSSVRQACLQPETPGSTFRTTGCVIESGECSAGP